jgi:hypothetical protein
MYLDAMGQLAEIHPIVVQRQDLEHGPRPARVPGEDAREAEIVAESSRYRATLVARRERT